MELSILVATVTPRASLLSRLLHNLEGQLPFHAGQAEVIVHTSDDKPMGQKFNELYAAASGRLAVQVDDDDLVAANFVTAILDHSSGHDFVGYKMRFTLWGERHLPDDYIIDPARFRSTDPFAPIDDKVRILSPKCPVLTEHAQRFTFESYWGSDHAFIADLIRNGYPFSPTFVNETLYWYDCWPAQSLGTNRESWTPQRQIPPYEYGRDAFTWIT